MPTKKVINIGAEQLIALPAGFRLDVEQVEIQRQEDSLLISVYQDNKDKKSIAIAAAKGMFPTDFYHSLIQWRKDNE